MTSDISKKISIVLVDDHPIVLEGLKSALAKYEFIDIINVFNSGKEFLAQIQSLNPEIVLLDIGLPDYSGIKIVEFLKKEKINVKILIYTMFSSPEYLKNLISLGIKGFLLKDSPIDELISALKIIHQGGNYFQQGQFEHLFNHLPQAISKDLDSLEGENLSLTELISKPTNLNLENRLTDREKEILTLIVEGNKNKEIALKLNLNQRTVETHRRNLMIKLNIKNQALLVKYALENNL